MNQPPALPINLPALTEHPHTPLRLLAGLSSDASDAIKRLAQDLFEGGSIEPRVFRKVPGVKDLTEEVLLVASDAVQVVVAAAPSPAPSGKAQQRLVCRLVAAVMDSEATFDDSREAGLP